MIVKLNPIYMESTNKYGNSSFWMDRFSTSKEFSTDEGIKNQNIYKLASQKRAISNFVSIVTNQRIPVQFATTGDSYTDGKSVVISSKLDKESEFDVAVGLALHEGSHIKLSDFNFLQSLANEVYRLNDYTKLNEICLADGVGIISTIKDILNWVEDRRIDNYIYQTSPGYRAYYQSLYDKYFNDALIDKALQSSEFTSETFDSYMFRLINLHSKYSRLSALKGLKRIYQIADLKNIGRLESTLDAFKVSLEIFRVICENVEADLKRKDEEANQKQPEVGNSSDGNQPSPNSDTESGSEAGESGSENSSNKSKGKSKSTKKEMDDETFEEMLDSMGLGNGGKSETGTDEEATSTSKAVAVDNLPDGVGDFMESTENENDSDDEIETVSLTDRQKDILKKKIEKQKDFVRGQISKTKISQTTAKSVDVIEKAGAEFVEVGADYEVSYKYKNVPVISCILVKNMTRELLEDDTFPFSRKVYSYKDKDDVLSDTSATAVENGIRLGTLLGKKMQVRSESRDTVFNRQTTGKLDKRMVASLGYGNIQAFYTKETDVYNKVNLHISVDASSSMSSGNMWQNTMTNVVALAKAVDMIPNLEVQISFRSTNSFIIPYIVIAYDSRKDKFAKVKQLFKYIRPYGTTPEGLCFEAIKSHMIGTSNGLDSYFLNISDGEPYFHSSGFLYTGFPAAEHTKKMIDGFRNMGIKVLSYFISEIPVKDTSNSTAKVFTEAYGKSAKFIDVTSVNEVSKTMNQLFMSK